MRRWTNEHQKRKQKDILNNMKTHWSSSPNVINEDTYMLFHLDRIKKSGYGYHNSRLKMIIKRFIILLLKK